MGNFIKINKKDALKLLAFFCEGKTECIRPGNYTVDDEHLKKAFLCFLKTGKNILRELDVLMHASWMCLSEEESFTEETFIDEDALIISNFLERKSIWQYIDFPQEATDQIKENFVKHKQTKEFQESYLYKRKMFSQMPSFQKKAIKEKLGNVCKLCGSTTDLTIDHIIPLSKGGDNVLENYQILCRSCNSKKGTKINKEY